MSDGEKMIWATTYSIYTNAGRPTAEAVAAAHYAVIKLRDVFDISQMTPSDAAAGRPGSNLYDGAVGDERLAMAREMILSPDER